ncbi:putative transporter [Limihaloglobus sulfuriphilus]|uniref:Putative transporter n=2 Tax=Limihaloglobus sulfuriphilus TaxID=1851148 RepID=A0A1Q2MC91_9BACT|nr:putative transporter [Limihaloglobus sulfuriphilus]
MPNIKASLGMDHGAAGGVFLFIASGYLAGIILSGIISCIIKHRSVIFISAVSCGTAVIFMSFSHSAAVLNGFASLTGLAAGLYLPSGIASITHIVKPSGWGRALSIHELAPNLAFLTAPLIAEVCLSFMNWRNTLQLIGCCSVAAGIIYYSCGKSGNFKGRMPAYSQAVSFFRMRSYWIMLVLFSLGVLSTLGIYTMIPLYLIAEFNYSRLAANTILSISRILTLVTVFVSGWSVDRFGLRRTLSTVFIVTSVLTLSMAAASGRFLIPAVFAQPLAAVCFFPAGIAALSAIFPEKSRNVGISLSVPLAFWIGAGLAPAALGAFADRGMFRAGFAVAGVAFLAGGVLSYFLDIPSVKEDAATDAEK